MSLGNAAECEAAPVSRCSFDLARLIDSRGSIARPEQPHLEAELDAAGEGAGARFAGKAVGSAPVESVEAGKPVTNGGIAFDIGLLLPEVALGGLGIAGETDHHSHSEQSGHAKDGSEKCKSFQSYLLLRLRLNAGGRPSPAVRLPDRIKSSPVGFLRSKGLEIVTYVGYYQGQNLTQSMNSHSQTV